MKPETQQAEAPPALLAPIIRIVLRVLAGYLIGKGGNQEVAGVLVDEQTVGVVVLIISESWFAISKWRGWMMWRSWWK
jgi:hypothetical protein